MEPNERTGESAGVEAPQDAARLTPLSGVAYGSTEADAAGETAGPAPEPPPGDEGDGEPPAAEFAEHARAVTQHILDLMKLDVEATVAEADRQQVDIDIEGPDSRIIIGKHGQTLDALQHLVGIVANKELRRRRRVALDSEGYQERRRSRREEELIEMARADALRAKELGQEAVIQYAVGSYERRLVHMAFKDDPDFTTYSEGEEPRRYVVVSPRD